MLHTRFSIFVILPALFFMLPACNSQRGADETLLRELDHCIKERTTYYEAREHQTDSLHALLNDSMSHTERFEIYGRLIEVYRSYNLDSQLYYAEKRLGTGWQYLSSVDVKGSRTILCDNPPIAARLQIAIDLTPCTILNSYEGIIFIWP